MTKVVFEIANIKPQVLKSWNLQAKKVKKTDTPLSSEASDDTAVPDNLDSETEAQAPANPLAVDNFRLSPEVKAVLKKKGIDALFDIQAQTLSHVLDGKDLLGRARQEYPQEYKDTPAASLILNPLELLDCRIVALSMTNPVYQVKLQAVSRC